MTDSSNRDSNDVDLKATRKLLVQLENDYFALSGTVTRKIEQRERLRNRITAIHDEVEAKQQQLKVLQQNQIKSENAVGENEIAELQQQVAAAALDQVVHSMVSRASANRFQRSVSEFETVPEIPSVTWNIEVDQVWDRTLDCFFESVSDICVKEKQSLSEISISNSLCGAKSQSVFRIRITKDLTVAQVIDMCKRKWGLGSTYPGNHNAHHAKNDYNLVDQGGVVWPNRALVSIIAQRLANSGSASLLYIQLKEKIEFGQILTQLQAHPAKHEHVAPFVTEVANSESVEQKDIASAIGKERKRYGRKRAAASKLRKLQESWLGYDPVLNTSYRLKRDLFANVLLLVLGLAFYEPSSGNMHTRTASLSLVTEFLRKPLIPYALPSLSNTTMWSASTLESDKAQQNNGIHFDDISSWKHVINWFSGPFETFLAYSHFGDFDKVVNRQVEARLDGIRHAWKVMEPIRIRRIAVNAVPCASSIQSPNMTKFCYPAYSSQTIAMGNNTCDVGECTDKGYGLSSSCVGCFATATSGMSHKFHGKFANYDASGSIFDLRASDMRLLSNKTTGTYIDEYLPSWLNHPSTRLLTVEVHVIHTNLQLISLNNVAFEVDENGLFSRTITAESFPLQQASRGVVGVAAGLGLVALFYIAYAQRRYWKLARFHFTRRDLLLLHGAHNTPKGASPFYIPRISFVNILWVYSSNWWRLLDVVVIGNGVCSIVLYIIVSINPSPMNALDSLLQGKQLVSLSDLSTVFQWSRFSSALEVALTTVRMFKYIRVSKLSNGVIGALADVRYAILVLGLMYTHVSITLAILANFSLGDQFESFATLPQSILSLESLSLGWPNGLDYNDMVVVSPVAFPLLYFTKSWLLTTLLIGLLTAILFMRVWNTPHVVVRH